MGIAHDKSFKKKKLPSHNVNSEELFFYWLCPSVPEVIL